MTTPKEIFDSLTSELCRYCDEPDVVIRIHMNVIDEHIGVTVIRHVRDPNKLFDTSRDAALSLSDDQLAMVKSKTELYFELSRDWEQTLLSTTLSIHQNGTWSVGSTSRDKRPS